MSQILKKRHHCTASFQEEVFASLFSFLSSWMKFHPSRFDQDEIPSQRKHVNSKRHFTIGRNNVIWERISSRDKI